MKTSLKFIATLGILFSACSHQDGTDESGEAPGPSALFTASMQNPAGCLDVSKVYDTARAARRFRMRMVDGEVTGGNPLVSDAFMNGVLRVTALRADRADNSLNLNQDACNRLGFGADHVNLVEATPTKVVTARFDAPGGYDQATYILSGDNELKIIYSRAMSTEHTCISGMRLQEDHQIKLTSLMTWGESIDTPEPKLSERFENMKARSDAFADPAQDAANRERESAYCKQVTGH
jgi:hypothetical protein